MYLNFTKVTIHNFRSFSDCEINLDNQGIVLIKGRNESEELCESNGSGKSSIPESVIWALYGKTSSGISDPSNKYLDDKCFVIVEFIIDNINYKVIRSVGSKQYGNKLSLYRDGEEISARNKTDTEKSINQILKINPELFQSIIFISQGFNSRLTLLGPSARKSRIESITGIQDKINLFKDKLSHHQKLLNTVYSNNSSEYNKILGEIQATTRTIESNETRLSHSNECKDIDVNSLKESLKILNDKLDNLRDISSTINMQLIKDKNEESRLKSNKSDMMTSIRENTELLMKTHESSTCPTCGQHMTSTISEKVISDIKTKISKCKKELVDINRSIDAIISKITAESDKLNKIQEQCRKYSEKISEINGQIDKVTRNGDASTLAQLITYGKSQLSKLKDKSSKLKDSCDSSKEDVDIIGSSINIVNKQFRDYMLRQILDFMNERLNEYSQLLYSDNKIIIINDKFNILLINKDNVETQYEALSGGEQRKADLALVLTQRDLALNISGFVCNLLILDEVYDNLDDKAISSVSNMFSNVCEEIDSTFIISHKHEVDIVYDSVLQIVKDKNNISKIYGVIES